MAKATVGLVAYNWFQNLFIQQVFNKFLLVPVTILGSEVIAEGKKKKKKKTLLNRAYIPLGGLKKKKRQDE